MSSGQVTTVRDTEARETGKGIVRRCGVVRTKH